MDNQSPGAVYQNAASERAPLAAWRQLKGEGERFRECHRLQKRDKSRVYRLVDPDDPSSAIIAKRCRRSTATLEYTFYEQVLPKMPPPWLRCHGLWQEENGRRCWLFLEDAGEETYQSVVGEHRALAARWLAALHVTTIRPELAALLPDRGAAYYLERLRATRSTLLGILAAPTLAGNDAGLLKSIVSQCEVLETQWGAVEVFCRELPRVPVHCDFQPKNLRVRTTSPRSTLLVFDWEVAGFGVSAVDLAELSSSSLDGSEFAMYWELVRNHWPHIRFEHIRRLADLGRILRLVNVLDWLSWSFAYEITDRKASIIDAAPQRVLRRMKSSRDQLNAAMQGAWTTHS